MTLLRNHFSFALSMPIRQLHILIFLGIIFTGLVLGGCLSTTPATPADRNLIYTQAAITKTVVALTLQAQLTQIAEGGTPTPTTVPTTEGMTPPPPTQPQPDNPTPTPPPVTDPSCDKAAFVEDVTIPDGTTFEPGETFVKTWRIRNTGTCTWNNSYAVTFDEGDAMGSPASFPLTAGDVPAGQEIEISVNLQAPTEPGEYRGDWKLRNGAGQVFGLGNSGNSTFWVIINVSSPVDVSLFFDNTHTCEGTSQAIFSIFNNGDTALQSAEITLTNLTSTTNVFGPFAHDGPFMGGKSECPPGGDAVQPGKKGFLGASLANASSGQNLRATFKICTRDGLGGSCTTETLDFTVP